MTYILTRFDTFEYVDLATVRNYELFMRNVNMESEDWRVFKEAMVLPEYTDLTKLNGELIYSNEHIPTKINWILDSDDGLYHEGGDDNFTLSTLDFILQECPILNTQNINGHILKLNPQTGEVDYFYKIVSNRLFYHCNWTIEYTEHYKNCIKFFNRTADIDFVDTICDIYNTFEDIDNAYDINDSAEEIFEYTYESIRV